MTVSVNSQMGHLNLDRQSQIVGNHNVAQIFNDDVATFPSSGLRPRQRSCIRTTIIVGNSISSDLDILTDNIAASMPPRLIYTWITRTAPETYLVVYLGK